MNQWNCMSHNRLNSLPLTHFPYCQVNPGLQVWPPEVAAVQLSSWIPAQGNLLSIYFYFFWRPARSIVEFFEGLQDITWSLLEGSRILPGALWKPAGSNLEFSGGMEDFTRRFMEASKILPRALWWPTGSCLKFLEACRILPEAFWRPAGSACGGFGGFPAPVRGLTSKTKALHVC